MIMKSYHEIRHDAVAHGYDTERKYEEHGGVKHGMKLIISEDL